jgi:aminoglycoside 2''-phosphotransferase
VEHSRSKSAASSEKVVTLKPTTNFEVYASAIQAACPEIDLQSLSPIEEGWSSFVVEARTKKADQSWIFRFPRRPEIVKSLEMEIALLPHLSRSLPVSVPQFELIVPGQDGRPAFVVYPRIPGIALDSALAGNPGAGAHLAEQIGKILTALHQTTLPWVVHRLLPLRTVLDWKRSYLDLYQVVRQQVYPLLDPPRQRTATALWEGFLRKRDHFRFAIALVHGDLGAEHILCDPARNQITGILDWEDACTGDPALDFVGLLQAGGEDFVHQVLRAYHNDLGANFWARLDFYTKITPFYEVLFGLETSDPVRTEAGLLRLQGILDD